MLLSVGHRRSGRGISFGVSLIVIFGYIGMASYAKIMVLKNNVPANIAMWVPNFVLFILCIFFSIMKYRGKYRREEYEQIRQVYNFKLCKKFPFGYDDVFFDFLISRKYQLDRMDYGWKA